jgi:UDP-glucose 4-epimerase
MNILLTGGAGYIGSHTAIILSEAGHEVVLLDNFCNSHKDVLVRLKKIIKKSLVCIEGDVLDIACVETALKEYQIDAVIHFAGLKAVGESVQKPAEYFKNNIGGTVSLIHAMKSANVKILVFSSSATVYGDPQYLPIDENHPTSATSPYGRTKLHIEEMLKDIADSDDAWKIICLRYFNPVGAHESGLIGEDPSGVPNNLMPFIARVAAGTIPALNVYGNDYPTKDGTGVRDYIHVMDLAEGHLSALDYIKNHNGLSVINLGTGFGFTVLEVISKYEQVIGAQIPFNIVARRPGDIAACFSKVDYAKEKLGWIAKRSLMEMCESSWSYQKNVPKGIEE